MIQAEIKLKQEKLKQSPTPPMTMGVKGRGRPEPQVLWANALPLSYSQKNLKNTNNYILKGAMT